MYKSRAGQVDSAIHLGDPTMPSMTDTARKLFDACESGKGWEVCREFCHADATFGAQADALAMV